MSKVAILQSNYIPWRGYFDIINSVDTFIIYDEVQYTKNDWRNRNRIKTKCGVQWISIPVRVESLNQKIFETKVSFKKWNIKHWNTLKTNYSKANNFRLYKDDFEDLYMNISSEYLSVINRTFIRKINTILDIKTKIIDSRELNLQGNKNEKLVDAIKKVGGEQYLSGLSAKNYINEELFKQENIKIEWKSYDGYKKYNQLHNNFNNHVSVIDLILNEGINSKKLYKNN